MKIDIHNSGGSGPYGNSAYAARAHNCLEYQNLLQRHPLDCSKIYPPGKDDKPNAMLVGSMVHKLAELEQQGTDLDREQPVVFIDPVCDWDPPQNAQDEAHRVYWGWRDIRTGWDDGRLLGTELKLEATYPQADGSEPIKIQTLVDRLVEDPDGVITLEDLKTSGRSGDIYTIGRTRLQMHLYTIAAWENGYDVQRIRVRQIVKTKTVAENIYDGFDLPTPEREEWILRYLKGALKRETLGVLGPWGAGCDFCYYKKALICKL